MKAFQRKWTHLSRSCTVPYVESVLIALLLFLLQVLPDSQPISTPDHLERTQSVRSLDSEPMVPPSVVPTPVQGPQKSGRKRKGIDRNSVRQSNSSASSATDNMTPSGSSSAGMLSSGHAHSLSSPCAKRQIIVQQVRHFTYLFFV